MAGLTGYTTIKRGEVRPGDWADHKSGNLDPRRVARIEGNKVWLFFLGDTEGGPFPAANYTFSREV